jgi:hypothetical protein
LLDFVNQTINHLFKVIFRGVFDLVLIQYLPTHLWAQALEFAITFAAYNMGAAFCDDLAVFITIRLIEMSKLTYSQIVTESSTRSTKERRLRSLCPERRKQVLDQNKIKYTPGSGGARCNCC